MTHEQYEEDECEGCGYPVGNNKLNKVRDGKFLNEPDKHVFMCDFCFGTFAGTAIQYPDQFKDKNTLFAMSYVGNKILHEISQKDKDTRILEKRIEVLTKALQKYANDDNWEYYDAYCSKYKHDLAGGAKRALNHVKRMK